jgi:hypothetical protein
MGLSKNLGLQGTKGDIYILPLHEETKNVRWTDFVLLIY